MPLSDTAARDIAEVLRKHIDEKAVAQIVDESLEIRGDKDFREILEKLVQALQIGATAKDFAPCDLN